jgi:RsiW-degrading membrane proteinase PrsW (M82 family)
MKNRKNIEVTEGRFHGPVLSHLGSGAMAALIGFSTQTCLNGALYRRLGPVAKSGTGAMLLGFGSGFCQTLGKVVTAALFLRHFQCDKARSGLAIGSTIGLGFGLTEVLLLATRHGVPRGLGLIERSIALWFHDYSGGLIALAFIRRHFWPIGLVVFIHAMVDGLAVALARRVSVYLFEVIFLVLTLLAWIVYRFEFNAVVSPKNFTDTGGTRSPAFATEEAPKP